MQNPRYEWGLAAHQSVAQEGGPSHALLHQRTYWIYEPNLARNSRRRIKYEQSYRVWTTSSVPLLKGREQLVLASQKGYHPA